MDRCVAAWPRVAAELVTPGWSRTRVEELAGLDRPADLDWRPLARGSRTHQQGAGAHAALAAVSYPVRQFAAALTAELAAAARSIGHPAPPEFNEVSWSRYPAATGRIALHLDPADFVGVIAIVTLEGRARFEIESAVDDTHERWTTQAGDLVLLRGSQWPGDGDGRPRHGAGPPIDGPRRILNLRTNVNGAERGYRGY